MNIYFDLCSGLILKLGLNKDSISKSGKEEENKLQAGENSIISQTGRFFSEKNITELFKEQHQCIFSFDWCFTQNILLIEQWPTLWGKETKQSSGEIQDHLQVADNYFHVWSETKPSYTCINRPIGSVLRHMYTYLVDWEVYFLLYLSPIDSMTPKY